ncbi:MAG: DNA repair protein RadA [Candidatus Ratteibacteria bacterium]
MKEKKIFFCKECGHESVRWIGKCPGCGGWNTFVAEPQPKAGKSTVRISFSSEQKEPRTLEEIEETSSGPRIECGIGELDRVLGGGVVPGSVLLLAGEPGIGKSTLMLLIAASMAKQGIRVLYISAEESLSQVKLRALRLGIEPSVPLFFLPESDLGGIKESLESFQPQMVAVDSIQLIADSSLEYAAGSPFQVRENSWFFIEWAKQKNVPIFLIGHITKEGSIAGPKLLEHMVDVVLSFEGEQSSNLRILRGLKNRFGATDEIGVFTMEEDGLVEVPEASTIFLSDRDEVLPGSVVFPALEGRRVLMVEVQSLVAPTYLAMPRRTFTGLDYHRVNLVLAVLEKKLNIHLASYDIYCSVSGGLKLSEPATDLAVAAAVLSSFKEIAPPPRTVFLGEIGLTGKVRQVPQVLGRVKEALRLGFTRAIIPPHGREGLPSGIETVEVSWIQDLSAQLFAKD